MVTINLATIAPYIIGIIGFFVSMLLCIGAYYIYKFEAELGTIKATSRANVSDFYEKYEDIQHDNTEMKLCIERLKTEHEMKMCKGEQ